MSRLYPERLRSPLGRRSNAASWLIVRDVGQWAEHDIRALIRVASAFIAEGTRRLSTLLTGDVPPRHLLCPVHSAGRRCQGHPADSAPVQSVAETVRPCCAVHCTHPLCEKLPPARRDYADLGCQGARRLLQHKILVATSAMFLGPHVWAQYSCTCPPLAIKGEACNVTTQTQLRLSILKLPQQSNTQWSRVLRSSGLNHSKLSRVHVFDVRLERQAKRLSPFLILGFRVGALRHPAGEFPLRHLARQVGG
jgi:hypothetical protein